MASLCRDALDDPQARRRRAYGFSGQRNVFSSQAAVRWIGYDLPSAGFALDSWAVGESRGGKWCCCGGCPRCSRQVDVGCCGRRAFFRQARCGARAGVGERSYQGVRGQPLGGGDTRHRRFWEEWGQGGLLCRRRGAVGCCHGGCMPTDEDAGPSMRVPPAPCPLTADAREYLR